LYSESFVKSPRRLSARLLKSLADGADGGLDRSRFSQSISGRSEKGKRGGEEGEGEEGGEGEGKDKVMSTTDK
jgi:hypothetical protein